MLSPAHAPAAPADDAGFAALYRAHFDFVYRTLRRLGVPPALCDDAAQEVFVVVLRRRHEVGIGSMRGWIFGITRRIAWRVRRSGARQRKLSQALADAPPRAVDGPTAIAEREASALLGHFLERLDEDKRAVFLLAELEQMTAPEISRALGIKENTVYSRLRAARQDFDRSFSRLRRSERRATGEAVVDERALLLSRARRSDAPRPGDRRRVWIALGGPAAAFDDASYDGAFDDASREGVDLDAADGDAPHDGVDLDASREGVDLDASHEGVDLDPPYEGIDLDPLAGDPVGPAAALARPEAVVGASLGAHVSWGIAVALVGVLAVAGGRSLGASSGASARSAVSRDLSGGTSRLERREEATRADDDAIAVATPGELRGAVEDPSAQSQSSALSGARPSARGDAGAASSASDRDRAPSSSDPGALAQLNDRGDPRPSSAPSALAQLNDRGAPTSSQDPSASATSSHGAPTSPTSPSPSATPPSNHPAAPPTAGSTQPVQEDMSVPPGPLGSPTALAQEIALLAGARAALRAGDYGGAEALLDRHAREFPRGALVDERRLSTIAALCGLGAHDAAAAEAARAAIERPGSTFARRAAALCPAATRDN